MPRFYVDKLFVSLAPALLLGFAEPATEGDKLSKNDKKWLEQEVAAFITVEEVEIFHDLSSKDRELFRELFWARRDPDPRTPDNEFREELKRRIKRADEEGRLLEPNYRSYIGGRTKTLLGELLDTKIENPAIPFETWECFFQAEEGSVYVPTLFEIQADALSWNEDTAQVTLFGAVQNSEGLVLHPFEQAVDLVKNEDGTVSYELPLQVASGEYTFHFGVLDDKSNAVGTKVFPVVVPAFGDTLGLSSVIVYSEARQVADVAGTPGHAFQFGSTHLVPITSDTLTYKTSDNLGLFYFVYGYGVDQETSQPALTEQYVFFKDGKRLTQTAVQPLPADDRNAVGNVDIALSHFEPGNYRVQIKVIDRVKEETLTQELEFALN